ncbi:MAG: alpha/beta hydrolase, partial [Halanaerobium sp.]
MLKEKIEIEIIENFYSEVLNNKRKIRIYLPPSYSTEKNKYYPVLYVHDGQNVFQAAESYSGESWNLHQTAELLIRENLIEEIIIVAADNMQEERLSEYAHQDGIYKGKKVRARGFDYEKFLVRELMPYLAENYRIKMGAENTALMGSSMGGLVTFNIGLRRTDLFSKLAVMSPSFWWGKTSPLEKINSFKYDNLNSKIWLDTGEAEGKFMSFSPGVISRLRELKNNFKLDLIYYQVPEAVHSETAWAERVHCPLLYFYG